jgi:hypothetical protein
MVNKGELAKDQTEEKRRKEPRFQSVGQGELTVVDSPETHTANVVDVSRSGLQVELASPVPAGSAVELKLKDVSVFAEVGDCRNQPTGKYRLGLVTNKVVSRA